MGNPIAHRLWTFPISATGTVTPVTPTSARAKTFLASAPPIYIILKNAPLTPAKIPTKSAPFPKPEFSTKPSLTSSSGNVQNAGKPLHPVRAPHGPRIMRQLEARVGAYPNRDYYTKKGAGLVLKYSAKETRAEFEARRRSRLQVQGPVFAEGGKGGH